jgi:hypothetical protein
MSYSAGDFLSLTPGGLKRSAAIGVEISRGDFNTVRRSTAI